MASNTVSIEQGSEAIHVNNEAVFLEEPDRKYVCPVCLVVMRDAMQTICGHRFCKRCIERVATRSGRCKCPVDNTWFHTKDEMFPDIAVRREIQCLRVRCYHHETGCEWMGELLDLQVHMASCEYVEVVCDYNCGEKNIRRAELLRHQEICDLRPVNCEHCTLSTTSVDITRHQLLDCRKFPVVCSLCGKCGINREDISCHLNKTSGDCPRVIIPCSYEKYGCQFVGRREIMSDHMKEMAHLHLEYVENKVDVQNERIDKLTEMLTQVTSSLVEHKKNFCSFVEKMMESQSISYNGRHLWKITLVPNQNKYISHPFYTGKPGYKVRIYLELKGHTESNQSYASLFVVHQQGQFDDELFFPFNARCRVALFSNCPGKSHDVEINSMAMPRCRTEGEMSNIQRGRLRFLQTEELLSDVYCVENNIYLDIKVEVYQ